MADWAGSITYSDDGEYAYIPKNHPAINLLSDFLMTARDMRLTKDDILEGTKLYIVKARYVRRWLGT